jgi:hypothetical protein
VFELGGHFFAGLSDDSRHLPARDGFRFYNQARQQLVPKIGLFQQRVAFAVLQLPGEQFRRDGTSRIIAPMIHQHAQRRGRQKPINMQRGRRDTLQQINRLHIQPGHFGVRPSGEAAVPLLRTKQHIQRARHQRMIPRQKLNLLAR